MRDILAALLRSRGYIHNDEADPRDLPWFSPQVGYRPLLACVAHEISREIENPSPDWDTYEVSIARRWS